MAATGQKRVREDPTVRRQKILAAAEILIGERGFNGVTLQDLARHVGLSNAGLLHYFASKDKLLLGLLEDIGRREIALSEPFNAAIREAERNGVSTLPAVRIFLDVLVQRFSDQLAQSRFLVVLQTESIDPAHPAHDWFQQYEVQALHFMGQILAPFVPRPEMTARWLHALLNGLGQQWLRAPDTFNLLDEWQEALTLILPKDGTGAR
ncbi:TetR/AcrR family transcriptional regulator [Sphingobium sufflavum]|uniref:TetR/AcrR family transcriptional regulator n=1 Tax=Sphingobium sufflavum TaxID=1129547 RepID=UPI001F396F3E|nr:TetR/AcrR family transcriptional regulator [Sphingobium sufflavum]MCE7796498.1 TetR/AcrR family transcriptional regulator [Sphingobium sufflavum]